MQSDGPGQGSTFRVRINLESNESRPEIDSIDDFPVSDLQSQPEPKFKNKPKKRHQNQKRQNSKNMTTP